MFKANYVVSYMQREIKISYILYVKTVSVFAAKSVRSVCSAKHLTIFQQNITAIGSVSTLQLNKLSTNDFVKVLMRLTSGP